MKWKGTWSEEAIHVKVCEQDVVRRSEGCIMQVKLSCPEKKSSNCPQARCVTFDLYHDPSIEAFQPAQSRNCGDRLSRLLMVYRWNCSTHAGSGLCGRGRWKVTDVVVFLMVSSRLCCNNGIVCGLPVGFQWSVKPGQNMMVSLWVYPRPSLHHGILSGHFRL